MIVFSFLCVYYAMELRQGDPQNIVWTYLLWVSIALAIFAISRSLGHIVKQLLIITHHQAIDLGTTASLQRGHQLFCLHGGGCGDPFFRAHLVHLPHHRPGSRRALQKAHKKLLYMNQNLEKWSPRAPRR
jgi:two-component system NtrC family sensor kinase